MQGRATTLTIALLELLDSNNTTSFLVATLKHNTIRPFSNNLHDFVLVHALCRSGMVYTLYITLRGYKAALIREHSRWWGSCMWG